MCDSGNQHLSRQVSLLYFDWHPAREPITLVYGNQSTGLLLPASEDILAAPFVPSGPKDVKADTGKIYEEERELRGGGEKGRGRKGEGVIKEALMKPCMGEKQAHTSRPILFYF